jgi:hypothetical protein
VNEHEIEFAEETAQRGFEASHMMNNYLAKVIKASIAYGDTIKAFNRHDWSARFAIADWSVKFMDTYSSLETNLGHGFLLKYKKITLARLGWTIAKVTGKKDEIKVTDFGELNEQQLFYITEYVNHVDVELTQMSTMMQKVNL